MRKTARPVVWEGAGAQSPAPDPIGRSLRRGCRRRRAAASLRCRPGEPEWEGLGLRLGLRAVRDAAARTPTRNPNSNLALPLDRFMGSRHGPKPAPWNHEPKAEDPKMRGGQRWALESLSAPHLWALIRRFMERFHGPPTAAHWGHEPVPATSSRRVVGGLLEAPSNYSCPRTAAASRRHRFMERSLAGAFLRSPASLQMTAQPLGNRVKTEVLRLVATAGLARNPKLRGVRHLCLT